MNMLARTLLAALTIGVATPAVAQSAGEPVVPPEPLAQPVRPEPPAEVIPQPPVQTAPFAPAQPSMQTAPFAGPAPFVPYAPPQNGPPAPPVPEFTSHLDSSLATSIVDLSLGVSLAALGWFMIDRPARGALVGAGLGTIAVGVPMLVVGTKRVRYPRHSEPVYAFGTSLASIGGTLSGMGIGLAIGQRQDYEYYGAPGFGYAEPNYAGAGILTGVGALLGLAGAGFMTLGANRASPEDAEAMLRERKAEVDELAREAGPDGLVPRSVARRTAGQVLVTIGAASFTGALIAGIAQAGCSGDFCGLGQLLITLPLAGQGVITTAIGIPLWVSGDARVSPEELVTEEASSPPTWTPEVSVGAGNLTMTMRF